MTWVARNDMEHFWGVSYGDCIGYRYLRLRTLEPSEIEWHIRACT